MNLLTICLFLLLVLLCPQPASAASTEAHQSQRPDGSVIHWRLVHPEGNAPRGLLVVAQGSGCLPVANNPMLREAMHIAPSFTALMIDKYGVTPEHRTSDPIGDCPPAYWAGHTVSQRVADHQQVLRELAGASWWNGQLVLFGGSEGGAMVARLAPRVAADAAVIYSTGLGEPLAETIRRVIPPFAAAEANAHLAAARASPNSTQLWGGNSYRWWADIADSVLVQELLRSTTPVLLIQGGRDRFAPPSSALAARRAYEAAGRSELVLWEYPDYDHFMVDAQGRSHREEVFARARSWIRDRLQDNIGARTRSLP